jgi:hypothetical protein
VVLWHEASALSLHPDLAIVPTLAKGMIFGICCLPGQGFRQIDDKAIRQCSDNVGRLQQHYRAIRRLAILIAWGPFPPRDPSGGA